MSGFYQTSIYEFEIKKAVHNEMMEDIFNIV